jgi:hypothetical protein
MQNYAIKSINRYLCKCRPYHNFRCAAVRIDDSLYGAAWQLFCAISLAYPFSFVTIIGNLLLVSAKVGLASIGAEIHICAVHTCLTEVNGLYIPTPVLPAATQEKFDGKCTDRITALEYQRSNY